LAREEFTAVDVKNTEPWIKLAKLYAEYDIKGTAAVLNAAEFAKEKGLASLLYFILLDYSRSAKEMGRPFGEKAIADLPDCARFYQGVYGINTFNMIYSPDGSPFQMHLARRIVPALQEMRGLPSEVNDAIQRLSRIVKPSSGGLLGWLSGGQSATKGFSMQEFFTSLATVLKALSATTPKYDQSEP